MTLSKKAKGTIWIIAAVVIGIPLVVILVLLLSRDAIVREAVQVGGKTALGVDTRLSSASVSLWGRSIALNGLDVANPPGFTSSTFVKADLIGVSAELSTLRRKEIHLYLVTLNGPEFTYEIGKPGSNISVLMNHLKGNDKAPQPAAEKGEPVKLKIDRLTMTNAKVHVVAWGKPIEVSLGAVEMSIDDGHGNAVPTDQVLSAVLAKLAGSITDTVTSLPKAVTKDILPSLKKEASDLPSNLQKSGEGFTGSLKRVFGGN